MLYRSALEIEVLNDQDQRESSFTAIQHRHDCVDRNGRDKANDRLTVFTTAYVSETADLFRMLVDGYVLPSDIDSVPTTVLPRP